jgi:CBS domain-containing protein
MRAEDARGLSIAPSRGMKTSRVTDIMNPKLLYIREGDRLTMARSKIIEFGVTAIPVLDENHRPVGVVSLRDLDRIGHVEPSSPVYVVRDDATIEEGARILLDSGMHHLVVVDGDGIAIGMVSAIDFVRAFSGRPTTHPVAFSAY